MLWGPPGNTAMDRVRAACHALAQQLRNLVSKDRPPIEASDLAALDATRNVADYWVVNVSSPNTPRRTMFNVCSSKKS